MTMPSLIANYQKKQTVSQLKKVYSELSQSAELAKLKYGDMSLWDYSLNGTDFFVKYLSSSYNQISSTTVGSAKQLGIIYYNTSGKEEDSLIQLFDSADIITLPSGVQIFCASDNRAIKQRKFYMVDLNGFTRPNKIGRDIFSFSVSTIGVRPTNVDDDEIPANVGRTRDELRDGPSKQNYNCSRNARGLWCSALIMADGWEIRDDYPW